MKAHFKARFFIKYIVFRANGRVASLFFLILHTPKPNSEPNISVVKGPVTLLVLPTFAEKSLRD